MGRENQDKGRRAVPKERHIRTHSHSDLFFDKATRVQQIAYDKDRENLCQEFPKVDHHRMDLRVILVDIFILMSLSSLCVSKPWGMGLGANPGKFGDSPELSDNRDDLKLERRLLDFTEFLAELHSPARHGDSRTKPSVVEKRHGMYGIPVRNFFPGDLKRELLPVSNQITPFGTRLFLKTEKPIGANRNLFRYG